MSSDKIFSVSTEFISAMPVKNFENVAYVHGSFACHIFADNDAMLFFQKCIGICPVTSEAPRELVSKQSDGRRSEPCELIGFNLYSDASLDYFQLLIKTSSGKLIPINSMYFKDMQRSSFGAGEDDTIYPDVRGKIRSLSDKYAFPDGVFCFTENYSQKGVNAGNLISVDFTINEPEFPPSKNQGFSKSSLIMKFVANESGYELLIPTNQFNSLCAEYPDVSSTGKKDPLYVHAVFDFKSPHLLVYINANIEYCIKNFESSSSFGCCSRYQICSDCEKCVHPNFLYAKGCQYRANLEDGRNFYKSLSEEVGVEKNISPFPDRYCVLDLETSGLSVAHDAITEVSAIIVRNGVIVNTFSSLLSSGVCVNKLVEKLTGITTSMLDDAPPAADVLRRFYDFVGDSIIVGHNINFDVRFLQHNFEKYLGSPFTNKSVDTMRLFRDLCPDSPHHRLSDLAAHYQVDYSKAHRALDDCIITNTCFMLLKKDLSASVDDLVVSGSPHRKPVKRIIVPNGPVDESSPLYGKHIVFTGALRDMTRSEGEQLAVNCGAFIGHGVTSTTDILVLGSGSDGKSSKLKKAESLISSGKDLAIISEDAFFDILK